MNNLCCWCYYPQKKINCIFICSSMKCGEFRHDAAGNGHTQEGPPLSRYNAAEDQSFQWLHWHGQEGSSAKYTTDVLVPLTNTLAHPPCTPPKVHATHLFHNLISSHVHPLSHQVCVANLHQCVSLFFLNEACVIFQLQIFYLKHKKGD